MTPQELKLSILSRAFQGKLVEQISEEGVGTDLLPVIQEECKKRVSVGQIKKFKALSEITDSDVDFDVPDTWHLIRLGSLCQLLDGEKRSGESYPYLEARYLRGKAEPAILTEGKYVATGTNVILVDGENSGEVFRLTESGYMGSTFKVLFVPDAVLLEYVIYFLQYHKNTLRNNKKGAAIPHLNKDIFFNLVLPLPPLAEQKRIVAKIEELLPLIDRYEQAWSKVEDFNKRFPVDMHKSILQMAIQGKLVPQFSEEGTGEELYQQIQTEKQALIKAGKIKKEKPLPEFTEEDIPFDIPETWKWVQFGTLYSLSNGTASRGSKDGLEHPVLRLADLSNNVVDTSNIRKIKLTDKEFASHMVQEDDLIFIRVNGSKDRVATAFRYTSKDTISYCDHLFCGHKCSAFVDADFIMFIFNCPSTRKQLLPEIKTTAGQNTISQSSMAKILLPLPPLAEQKRIVAKLEEILPLCERLK